MNAEYPISRRIQNEVGSREASEYLRENGLTSSEDETLSPNEARKLLKVSVEVWGYYKSEGLVSPLYRSNSCRPVYARREIERLSKRPTSTLPKELAATIS